MRSPRGHRTAILLLCATLIAPTLAYPTIASAEPAALRAKRAQAIAAQKRLDDLSDQLELKVEEFNGITEQLAGTRQRIRDTEESLAQTEARLAASQLVLSDRVNGIYRGESVDMVEVLLGTTSFDDFLTRLDALNRIAASDAELVDAVAKDRDRIDAARVSLENRQAEQEVLRAQAEAKKHEVEAAYATQRSFVGSITREVAALVKAEQARLARIAAERARRAAALARPGRRTGDVGRLGAPHPEALAEARRHLGVRYVWGGTTPSGFDCSGLVQYSYRKIGIQLPRTSRSQFRVGAFIPADRLDLLEPGDLVFFGYGGDPGRIHHVGMYAGGGSFIHAPATGDVVRYSSLNERIASRGDYVGAVRP